MVEVVSNLQFVDDRVTQAKFERQVVSFESQEDHYRQGGIICSKIEYPYFEFIFLAKKTLINGSDSRTNQNIFFQRSIPSYLFAIRVDYSNFDLFPPSIRTIDPMTSEQSNNVAFVPFISPDQQDLKSIPAEKFKKENQRILISDHHSKLFICLRGIKEYHEHPQHDGDFWFLYRLDGKGNILNILDRLQLYSIVNANKLFSSQQKLNI